MRLTLVLASFLQYSWWNVAAALIFAAPPVQRRSSLHHVLHSQTQPQQHAGVLPILEKLKCGDSILGYRTTENGHHNVTVERVACVPPIFLLRDFVTADECDAIQSTVTTMEPAQTASGLQEEVTRKNSFVAWLGNDEANGLIGRLADAGRRLMLVPAPSLGVEDMQVVRYSSSGEYKLHHDGNDRILTVLYYLDGEGETWFPLARQRDEDSAKRPQTRQEALYRTEGLKPGVDGVVVSASLSTKTNASIPISRGDAVAFFSYLNDGSMDWNAIHSGLPARNEKIVANHFFRHVPITNLEQ